MESTHLLNAAEVAKVEDWPYVLVVRSSQEMAIEAHDLRAVEEGRQAWSQTANAEAYRLGDFPSQLVGEGIPQISLLKLAELVVACYQDDIL